MSTEDLKQLAEYMGYETELHAAELIDALFVMVKNNEGEWIEYNPLTNAEQDRELEIKFEITTRPCNATPAHRGFVAGITKNDIHFGDTPSEARLYAAIAAIKE